jgi:hypothetical protein
MSWTAITYHQPVLSPQKRLGIAAGILVFATVRCIAEFLEYGLSPKFWLFSGFILVATIFEWKHYNKPREISIKIADGRLEYSNQFTHERHTVYQSRVQQISVEEDALVFYAQNNYTTRIPLKFFEPEQVQDLKTRIADWKLILS